MAMSRRRDLVASRRRKADEGEEDEVGSLEYDSQSDASVFSGANESLEDEVSEGSRSRQLGGDGSRKPVAVSLEHKHAGNGLKPAPLNAHMSTGPPAAPSAFTHTEDTHAMANGLKPAVEPQPSEVLQFEDSKATLQQDTQPDEFSQLSKRENQRGQINKSKDLRLGLKHANAMSLDNSRNMRRRGRESSSFGVAINVPQAGPSSIAERWNHDLHDLLESDPSNKQEAPIVEDIPRRNLPMYTTSAKGPEPLSRTVTIGHVTLRVSIPGMTSPITYDKMPLKYHIRLPDLRPPLRRDKPVRVAIPHQTPRYIFPSVDRSFIFIPRAQRPNQQSGRRPFGSRRNSALGGSSYTPSIAMSRRSSIARDGIMSPGASSISKPPYGAPVAPSRPVVKLPAGARPQASVPNGAIHAGSSLAPTDGVSEPMHPPPGKPAFQSSWTGQLHMHQPRPQKTVSVTTIESPSKEKIHAPQQHELQPFHHQVPAHVNGVKSLQEYTGPYPAPTAVPYTGVQTAGTPAHLPENAINAQPFQPDQPQMFYPTHYPMQDMVVYPSTESQTTQFAPQTMMAQPMYMQPTPHGSYLVPVLSPSAVPPITSVAEAPVGTNAYESNGTVYYYDTSQYGEGAMNNGAYTSPGPDAASKGGNDVFYPQPPMNYYPTQ